jgi:acetyl esterase/lipase
VSLRCFCLLFCLGTPGPGRGQGPMGVLKLPVPEGGEAVHYGADRLQFGELRLPKVEAGAPIVLIVHGGCWSDHMDGYDPRATSYELMKPLAAALTAAGAATWNVEYRRRGSPGGSWATTYLDLALATDYLRRLAAEHHLDLSRVVVVGHSSGGQFALWLGGRAKLAPTSAIYTKNPLRVSTIIDFDGPPDLAAAQPVEKEYCPIPAVSEFMEGTPASQAQRYHDGSAQPLLPLGVPQTIVTAGLLQGEPALVASYKTAAEAKGDTVTVVPLKSASHFQPLDPNSASGKALVATIMAAAGISGK